LVAADHNLTALEPQQTRVGDRRYHTAEAAVCGDELVHEPA
jgi:hypothetical protein